MTKFYWLREVPDGWPWPSPVFPQPDDPQSWVLVRSGRGRPAAAEGAEDSGPARLYGLAGLGPDPDAFLGFADQHLRGLGRGDLGPVDEAELWELLGLALPAPPPVAVGGRDMPLLSPITWGDILFALAYVVPWAAFWIGLRRREGWAEIEPLALPDLPFGPDRLHGAVGIRAWDGGRWAWVPACEHLGRPGWGLLAALGLKLEPPVPWPLCGREECPFGRAELFWRGLGFGPVDPNPQGASRPFYPGLVGFYVEGDPPPPWRAPEDRLKYGFILALNHLPLGRGATGGLRLLPAAGRRGVGTAPALGGFAAWVYKQLTDRVRRDLGEPGEPPRCLMCGESLVGRRRGAKFCSAQCRFNHYYARHGDRIRARRRGGA
jgi:hypothetical protein